MKIAINVKHGGFNLSPRALMMYAKRKGKDCYFFEHTLADNKKEYTYKSKSLSDLELHLEDKGYFPSYVAFSIPDITSIIEEQRKLSSMTIEERKQANSLWEKHTINEYDIRRNDIDLIEVIEELGIEQASGYCSKLKIVEIPDDVDWFIDEYDGWEHVAEKHRTWS